MARWLDSQSLGQAWNCLVSSRCKHWDDRELDIIEGFKFFSFFLGNLCITSEYQMFCQTVNTWVMNDFFKEWMFTAICSANVMADVFFAFSGFLGSYRLL
jgi:hypothetical protein